MEAEELGLERFFPAVGPQSVMGIELNLYAAELARVTIWIGQIQWMLRHGWGLSKDPILKPLDQISCRDALLNPRRDRGGVAGRGLHCGQSSVPGR
jgi:type II restriction/modification system DNA methylase subunit YeeA